MYINNEANSKRPGFFVNVLFSLIHLNSYSNMSQLINTFVDALIASLIFSLLFERNYNYPSVQEI